MEQKMTKRTGRKQSATFKAKVALAAMAAETPLEKTRNAVQARGVTSHYLSNPIAETRRPPSPKRLACLPS